MPIVDFPHAPRPSKEWATRSMFALCFTMLRSTQSIPLVAIPSAIVCGCWGEAQAACHAPQMFSTKLDRRRQFSRLAVLAAATLLAVGIALIAVWAVRAFNMLEAAEVDRALIIVGVLIALAVLFVLCLIAYVAVRAVGRFT